MYVHLGFEEKNSIGYIASCIYVFNILIQPKKMELKKPITIRHK
jgi:hypothetical protein